MLYKHSVVEWIQETLQSDYLLKAMQLYPKKEFVKDPDGTWVQCISEPWTGKNLWKLWVMILHKWNSIIYWIITLGFSPRRQRWDPFYPFWPPHLLWQVKTFNIWHCQRIPSYCQDFITATEYQKLSRWRWWMPCRMVTICKLTLSLSSGVWPHPLVRLMKKLLTQGDPTGPISSMNFITLLWEKYLGVFQNHLRMEFWFTVLIK